MDLIINYLVAEFERIFPDQRQYSELVRNAILARTEKIRVIMSFYQEKRARISRDAEETNICGAHQPDFTALDSMCCRAVRAAIIDEASRNSPQTTFMMRGFVALNQKKFAAMITGFLVSDEISRLLVEYPFISPLVSEVSSQEWLSSLLGQ